MAKLVGFISDHVVAGTLVGMKSMVIGMPVSGFQKKVIRQLKTTKFLMVFKAVYMSFGMVAVSFR